MYQFGPRTTFDLQVAHIILQVAGPATLFWTNIIGATAAASTSVTMGIAASVLTLILYGKYAGQPGVK